MWKCAHVRTRTCFNAIALRHAHTSPEEGQRGQKYITECVTQRQDCIYTRTYIQTAGAEVWHVHLLWILTRGDARTSCFVVVVFLVFFLSVFACAIPDLLGWVFLLPSHLLFKGKCACVLLPRNPTLSQMSAQVRIIVGSVKGEVWCRCADLYSNSYFSSFSL